MATDALAPTTAATAAPNKLFTPLQLGRLGTLSHRVVLAPLTRNRAEEPTLVPSSHAVEYYKQRTTHGCLLISEATYISTETLCYPHVPGIFTDAQVAGWRRVTDAVHACGGSIMCQLWHVGRVAHPSYAKHPLATALADVWGTPGVSASDVPMHRAPHTTFDGKFVEAVPPRPLGTDEIPRLVRDYVHAAKCAKRAGFDGVELHGAHGYLLDQFLNKDVNLRTDAYGGSIEGRCRLLFEVLEALITVWGPGRVAVRLSPHGASRFKFYDCSGDDADEVYAHVVRGLNRLPLAYLLLTELRWNGRYDDKNEGDDPMLRLALVNCVKYRELYDGVLIGAGGFTPKTAKEALEAGHCDAIGFGRWFISNPDLVERLRTARPLNRYDRATFYSYGSYGYTDYPDFAHVVDHASLVPQERIGASLKAAKL